MKYGNTLEKCFSILKSLEKGNVLTYKENIYIYIFLNCIFEKKMSLGPKASQVQV